MAGGRRGVRDRVAGRHSIAGPGPSDDYKPAVRRPAHLLQVTAARQRAGHTIQGKAPERGISPHLRVCGCTRQGNTDRPDRSWPTDDQVVPRVTRFVAYGGFRSVLYLPSKFSRPFVPWPERSPCRRGEYGPAWLGRASASWPAQGETARSSADSCRFDGDIRFGGWPPRELARPPVPPAQVQVEGGDQHGPDHDGVQQHAERHAEAELGQERDRHRPPPPQRPPPPPPP